LACALLTLFPWGEGRVRGERWARCGTSSPRALSPRGEGEENLLRRGRLCHFGDAFLGVELLRDAGVVVEQALRVDLGHVHDAHVLEGLAHARAPQAEIG